MLNFVFAFFACVWCFVYFFIVRFSSSLDTFETNIFYFKCRLLPCGLFSLSFHQSNTNAHYINTANWKLLYLFYGMNFFSDFSKEKNKKNLFFIPFAPRYQSMLFDFCSFFAIRTFFFFFPSK